MTDTTAEDEIQKLSDEELAKRLREYGESVGPLTPTTRPLFERRLLRRIGGGAVDGPDAGTDTLPVKQPTTPPTAQPPPDRYPSTPPLTPTGSSSIRSGEVPLSFTPPCTPSKDNGAAGVTLSITYYGIQVPTELECGEEKRVFINKKDVLAFLKQYPGSRFKAFSSESDAQNYADQPSETQTIQSPAVTPNKPKDKPSPVSESSAFRGPKPQDLIKLRRAIESGNLDTIKSLVWSNPRYLIGSGDTPVILQEGFRYNALHVVAMRNKAEAGRLLIDILEDEKFTELLYPDDSLEIRDARINFLVDLYLNTPDKGFCESPLHFACKFGHVEVVDLLASHPRTDKQLRNKYGELARDIACNRAKNPSAEVKEKIYKLLEDRVYVPLLRSDDNSRPAKIAKPWSSTNKDKMTRNEGALGLATEESPRETPLQVKAYAGPMSPSEAEAFRKFWTHPGSPATAEVRKYLEIRRGDSEKGLERIGRALAHNKLISWKEYWDFLDCFTDLSTNDGLKKLESYLINQSSQVEKEEALEKDLSLLEEQLGNFHLSSNPTSPMNSRAVITDPGAIFSGRPDKGDAVLKPDAEKPTENEQNIADDMVDNLARNLFVDFAKSSDNVEPAGNSHSSNSTNNNVLSKNPFLLTTNSTTKTTYEHKKTVGITDLEQKQNGHYDLKAKELDSKDPQIAIEENSQQPRPQETAQNGTGEEDSGDDQVSDDSSQGSEAGYLTAEEESDVDLEFEDCRDPMVFPDSGSPTKFFVMGNNPSKTDVDVLHALEGVQISPVSYPYITRWKNQVVCYSEQTRASWHSPARKPGSQTTPRRLPGAASRSGYYDSPSFENMSGLSSDSSASETDDSFRDVRANMRGSFFSP